MKKFYITTSIPYVNAPPHIGNILDSLYADVLARWHRQKGEETFFLTGSDEHGAKIARSAKESGKAPREFVDENVQYFQALKEALNLSYDDFIRTSDEKRHWPGAIKLWQTILNQGDLYKKTYQGLYCVGHEAFVTQKDLKDGLCLDHQQKPEVIKEENWFFRLSKYAEDIERRIANGELQIAPESRKNEILSFIRSGLEDVSFSRPRKDLKWGIPVPNDDSQTIYVWADALVNYLSAIGYGREENFEISKFRNSEHWWPADVQVIGKDNLRFHAAIWPGMLLSAGLELPKTIFVHGFVTVNGQKMSKSLGNIVNPHDLVKKYGTDATRYYFLKAIPADEDGDFSEEKFKTIYNGELANGLGNFASRVLTLGQQLQEIKAPGKDSRTILLDVDQEIKAIISHIQKLIPQKIEEFKFHEALAVIWDLIKFGDGYLNQKSPWKTKDQKVILNALVILDNVAGLLKPFLPETAERITASIAWEGETIKISKLNQLFPRLD